MHILKYALLACLFLYVSLWRQFPYEELRKTVVQRFAETLPLNLSVEKVGPSFPFQFCLENVQIGAGTFSFRIPDVLVRPDPAKFIAGETNIQIKDRPTHEQLQGEFSAKKGRHQIIIKLNNLKIKSVSLREYSFPVKLSGEATLQWAGENWGGVNGQAWVLLQRGENQGFPAPPSPFLWAPFDTVRAEIQIRQGILHVKRLAASGKDAPEVVLKDIQVPIAALEKGEFPDLSLFFRGASR